MKKLVGISLLSAVGLFAQGTAPANPPASTTPAPATKAHTGKKHHHHKKAGAASTPTAPASGATTQAPAAGK